MVHAILLPSSWSVLHRDFIESILVESEHYVPRSVANARGIPRHAQSLSRSLVPWFAN